MGTCEHIIVVLPGFLPTSVSWKSPTAVALLLMANFTTSLLAVPLSSATVFKLTPFDNLVFLLMALGEVNGITYTVPLIFLPFK